MKVLGREHYFIMEQFEKNYYGMRFEKEEKSMWKNGVIYQSGETNKIFLAYRMGYALGKTCGTE